MISLRFCAVPPSYDEVAQRAQKNAAPLDNYNSHRSGASDSLRSSRASSVVMNNNNSNNTNNNNNTHNLVNSDRETEKLRFQSQLASYTYLPFMPDANQNGTSSSSAPPPPPHVAAPIARVIQPGDNQVFEKRTPRLSNTTTSTLPIMEIPPIGAMAAVANHHQQHQNNNRQSALLLSSSARACDDATAASARGGNNNNNNTGRPTSARGRWLHNSSITLAGPDNCEILKDHHIVGMHHIRHNKMNNATSTPAPIIPGRRAASAQPNNNNNNQHYSPSTVAIADAARRAGSEVIMGLPSSSSSSSISGAAAVKIGASAGPQVSTEKTLRDLLSRETLQLRHSQRFAAAPRAVPGDHLHGSGCSLMHGMTSRSEVFAQTDASFANSTITTVSSIPAAASYPLSAFHGAAAGLIAPPVKSSSTALTTASYMPVSHYQRHRPQSARLATAESSPSDNVDDELNPAHSHKKKVTAMHHDVHQQTTNILQPWRGDGIQRRYSTADSPLVGKAKSGCGFAQQQQQQPRAALAVRDENGVVPASGTRTVVVSAAAAAGVRSTAQQMYDKTILSLPADATTLVEFGEGVSRQEMKRRMLRGTSTSFW